jgi:hypothetical protein
MSGFRIVDSNDPRLHQLLAAAVAAPSADNHHDWRIRLADDGIELLLGPGAASATSTRQILTLISLGAVAESMVIRASSMGLGIRVETDVARRHMPIKLAWTDQVPLPDPLDSALSIRHSNREVFYCGPALAGAELSEIQAMSQGRARSFWYDAPDLRSGVLSLMRKAETERFRNRELHTELYSAVRFDEGWQVSAPEGLPLGSLGMQLWERVGFVACRRWSVQRMLNCFGAHIFLGARAADLPCRWAPHVCTLNAEGSAEPAAVDVGRLMLRVWAHANSRGLAVQAFAAAPMYALPGATSISESLQAHLEQGWADLCGGTRPYIVLRMGRAPLPSVRSGRPATAGFLID